MDNQHSQPEIRLSRSGVPMRRLPGGRWVPISTSTQFARGNRGRPKGAKSMALRAVHQIYECMQRHPRGVRGYLDEMREKRPDLLLAAWVRLQPREANASAAGAQQLVMNLMQITQVPHGGTATQVPRDDTVPLVTQDDTVLLVPQDGTAHQVPQDSTALLVPPRDTAPLVPQDGTAPAAEPPSITVRIPVHVDAGPDGDDHGDLHAATLHGCY